MNPPQKQFPISSFSFILAALALLSLQPLHAATPSLFNTGVDAAGNPLPNGATDPHWTVVAGPGVPPVTPAAVLAEQYSGTYTQSALSRWVWVNTNGMAATETPYTFRLTFELTVATRSNLVLSGQWAVDNVARILLNGASNGIGSGTLILSNDVPTHFGTFHPFTLTNGFVLGTNTLDFVASDFGGIAGLNVTALNSSNFVVILPGARLWTGAGGNGLWSNPANWSNNVAPNPNDALIFPGPGGASVNDFPPATIFGAVQITGGAHTFGGAAFTAAGALSKFGPATLALNTNNPAYTGGTTVSAGTLLVNGATTNSALTLGGAGTSVSGTGHLGAFGNASGGGVVSPGGSGTGALLFSGSSTFDNTTTNHLQINGPTPGVDYDQIGIRGAVTLGNSRLELAFGYTPPTNTVFLLLTNDLADAITGRFGGLAQNALFTNGNLVLRINYTAGTGNDVTVTVLQILSAPGQPSNITGFHLLTNGLARLGVLGTANASYAIEASTNLPGHWTAVATNTADGAGFFEFIDADTLNFPIRFYRVRSP